MDESIQAWAGTRKLEYAAEGEMPDAVPLFGIGGQHVFTDVATGELEPGLKGSLGNYDRVTHDKNGTHHHRYAVALCGVPQSIAFAPRLFCIGDGMPAATKGGSDDSFQAPDERVHLESEALEARYKIWASSEIGRNWLVQLFSPGFIDWMTNGTPKTFSFQLTDGMLCGYTEGQAGAPELEALRAATAEVAERIQNECHEERGLGDAGREAIAHSEFDAKVEQKIASLKWEQAPPDAATALAAYRRVARRMARPYLDGFVAGVFITGLAALWLDLPPWWASVCVGLIPGVLSGIAVARKEIGDRARRFGLEAFAREYAKSRGLVSDSARGFQARHMDLDIPGAAEQVVTGKLPGDIEGSLALCRDKSNRRKPMDYNVLVAGGEIVLSEQANRELRTAAGLDDFCSRGAAKARSGSGAGSA